MTPSARSAPFEHGDDLRQRGERSSTAAGSAAARRRRVVPTVAPAPRVAGHDAAERARDPLGERVRAAQHQAAPRRRPRLGEARARSWPRSPARSPGRRAAGRRGRLAQLVGGADAERPAELDHSLRAEPDEAPEADELRLHLALELVDSARRPVSTSSRSRASIAGPIPRSSRTRPCRTSSATGAGVARISSAARRYARTL